MVQTVGRACHGVIGYWFFLGWHSEPKVHYVKHSICQFILIIINIGFLHFTVTWLQHVTYSYSSPNNCLYSKVHQAHTLHDGYLYQKQSASLLDDQLKMLTEIKREHKRLFTANRDKPECLICGSDVASIGKNISNMLLRNENGRAITSWRSASVKVVFKESKSRRLIMQKKKTMW